MRRSFVLSLSVARSVCEKKAACEPESTCIRESPRRRIHRVQGGGRAVTFLKVGMIFGFVLSSVVAAQARVVDKARAPKTESASCGSALLYFAYYDSFTQSTISTYNQSDGSQCASFDVPVVTEGATVDANGNLWVDWFENYGTPSQKEGAFRVSARCFGSDRDARRPWRGAAGWHSREPPWNRLYREYDEQHWSPDGNHDLRSRRDRAVQDASSAHAGRRARLDRARSRR